MKNWRWVLRIWSLISFFWAHQRKIKFEFSHSFSATCCFLPDSRNNPLTHRPLPLLPESDSSRLVKKQPVACRLRNSWKAGRDHAWLHTTVRGAAGPATRMLVDHHPLSVSPGFHQRTGCTLRTDLLTLENEHLASKRHCKGHQGRNCPCRP